MGLFINETTIMCVTPHILGHPSDYVRETVQVTVAMNGQDFNEDDSDAYVTFVGTGTSNALLKILLLVLLFALLLLGIVMFCLALKADNMNRSSRPSMPEPETLNLRDPLGKIPKAIVPGYAISRDGRQSAGGYNPSRAAGSRGAGSRGPSRPRFSNQ